jgi:hypothetical protein
VAVGIWLVLGEVSLVVIALKRSALLGLLERFAKGGLLVEIPIGVK